MDLNAGDSLEVFQLAGPEDVDRLLGISSVLCVQLFAVGAS